MTTASVTERWAEQWRRDGFLPVIDVLTPEDARQCRQAFDGLELFLVPIGPGPAGARYEAVFT